jgi:hypothetical protein
MLGQVELPQAIEDVTPEWLSSALSAPVTAITAEEVVAGSATKILVELEYAERGSVPARLCVKGGFDDVQRMIGGMGFRTEVGFFADLAERMPVEVPRCWYAATEGEPTGQSIVILDDLRADGATFGDPTVALTVDQAAATLEVMARWHARFWDGRGLEGAGWVTTGSPVLRHVIDILTSPEHFEQHMAQPKAATVPPALRDPETVRDAMRRLWSLDDAETATLLHGDTHIGNMYFESDGAPRFLDWQSVMKGPWSHDVANFLAGALTVEDRRASERGLLEQYLGHLRAHGGPEVAPDEAWRGYRRHVLHGFLWVLTPEGMQPAENTAAMAARYSAAADDLDVLAALHE